MDVEVLGSVPFLSRNRILPNCADNEIILRDGSVIKYESNLKAKDSSIISVVISFSVSSAWFTSLVSTPPSAFSACLAALLLFPTSSAVDESLPAASLAA